MKLALCIDPGHSPNTKETTGGKYSIITGMEEHSFNRAVADYLIELCDSHNIDYVDVAPVGTDYPLYKRTRIANEYYKNIKVDTHCVYVSIHANAGGGVGCEIWIHSKSIQSTKNLAKSVLDSICKITEQKSRGIKQGFVTNSNADFHVNRETNMVSMLIEYGFMDNKLDCYKLLDDDFRKKCAISTLQGIADIYNIQLDLDDEDSNKQKPIQKEDEDNEEIQAELEKYIKLYNKALNRAKRSEENLADLKSNIAKLL